ncbi:hypothetical protein PPERSA_04881 [Pseudocohnilembus persalinus]|uniref:PH domain-containing protein n=1 Tax=Pseudocohnilembus persalinus TaxID=266149 RepID=A0A0V0QIW4_PSEPJ|nr:hypothetical protein PPERSA_04881 [Pseudocohnilembus persalinus]|eukprot:KRX02259.1 hypothetical protein PPERSA_04881 [Pseudocohnilembus persalinus]
MQNRIQSGYIQVKRKRFWVIRYAEIYSNSWLCYYYNKGSDKPRFYMNLIDADIYEEQVENKNNSQCIKIVQKNKEISLLAETQKDHNCWLEILQECAKNQNSNNNLNKNNIQIQEQQQFKLQKFQDLDQEDEEQEINIKRPFVFDKKVIQNRFQGDDQLMLKANTSFFISEYKDLILTKVEEGIKTYMCKMGVIKQNNKNEQNLKKNPAKEILNQIYANNYLD